jgi:hypothetical protein
MTREEYITNKSSGKLMEILHSYYLEKYKGETALDFKLFSFYMSQWPFANEALLKIIRELDVKFEIMTITSLKTGQALKYM